MSIFHSYDIRGIYPEQINEEFCYQIGRRLALFFRTNKILVARDARISSPALHKALLKGIAESGADVLDIGVCSTPQAYFSQRFLELDAGVMITASHNPKEYNGIKFLGKGGVTIGLDQGLYKLQKMMDEDTPPVSETQGSYEELKTDLAYIDSCAVEKSFPFKIVLDQANAAANSETKAIQEMCTVVSALNTAVEGSFPGHGPDPLEPEAHRIVADEIKKHSADLGIIFDGDCDRVVFIDENGVVVRPDVVTGLLAMTYDEGKVVHEVRTSSSVIAHMKKQGLIPINEKVGRTNIISTMQKESAVLGGETSGHYMFAETACKECVPIAVKKMLEVLNKEKRPLSKIAGEMSTMIATPSNLNFTIQNKESSLAHIQEAFSDEHIDTLDGISVTFKDGAWFNIRGSNTQPGILRFVGEAHTQENLDAVVEKVKSLLE